MDQNSPAADVGEPVDCCAPYFAAGKARARGQELTAEQQAVLDDPRIKDRGVSLQGTNGEWALVGYDSTGHVPANPLVAIGQLFAAVPTIVFPEGKDVLQILWCPVDRNNVPGQRHYTGPPVHLFWRRADEIGDTLAASPEPHTADERFYLPTPCVLHPEQVVEYQYGALLPAPQPVPATAAGRPPSRPFAAIRSQLVASAADMAL